MTLIGIFLFCFLPAIASAMTWASTWKDILRGGPTRWKVDDINVKSQALGHILGYSTLTSVSRNNSLRIFCPLAGDDPFVYYAWQQGHYVTAVDIVPDALAEIRRQFGPCNHDWEVEKQGSIVIWKHKSGRATLYEGDIMTHRNELEKTFDAVYDKDSFGALDPTMRQQFCERVASYTNDHAVVYVEVKYKDQAQQGRLLGPPFHLERDDIMKPECFGVDFDYIAGLGKVYELSMDGMQQTGHILRRRSRSK